MKILDSTSFLLICTSMDFYPFTFTLQKFSPLQSKKSEVYIGQYSVKRGYRVISSFDLFLQTSFVLAALLADLLTYSLIDSVVRYYQEHNRKQEGGFIMSFETGDASQRNNGVECATSVGSFWGIFPP